MPLYGVPMLSSIVAISSGGMTVLIVSSIAAKRFSLSSIRVPGGPRTWSFTSPASTVGKKSRPMSGKSASERQTKPRKPATVVFRRARASARKPP